MFSSEKNIESLHELLLAVKRYAEERAKYVQLDFVSKMTVLAAALILGAVLFALLSIVILFFSYSLALVMAPNVGGMSAACGIIALIYAAAAMIIYLLRRKLIINPVASFFGQLFLNRPNDK